MCGNSFLRTILETSKLLEFPLKEHPSSENFWTSSEIGGIMFCIFIHLSVSLFFLLLFSAYCHSYIRVLLTVSEVKYS